MKTDLIPFESAAINTGPIKRPDGPCFKEAVHTQNIHTLPRNDISAAANLPPRQPVRPIAATLTRVMMTLPECAREAGVSRRFLEKEIARDRLVACKLSTRICRVRRSDWDRYLDQAATMRS
jgi:hypothetical protein